MPLGAHLPTSKGFEAALRQAQELECDCLQIFSKSPRQWQGPRLDASKAAAFRAAWRESGLAPLVAHDSYLINLAAPDEEIARKSIEAMIDEVERADTLGCDFLVTHCGAHLQKDGETGVLPLDAAAGDTSMALSSAVEAGLSRLAQSLKLVLEKTPRARVCIALENTAGQGTCLGGPFEHLSWVINEVNSDRLVVCLDTCHAFAAGHDVATGEGLDNAINNLESTVGLDKVKVIHLNDSKGKLGSRLDRHDHIGQGNIGREGMQRIINHPHLRHLPLILETPDLETMLETNLSTVRELQQA